MVIVGSKSGSNRDGFSSSSSFRNAGSVNPRAPAASAARPVSFSSSMVKSGKNFCAVVSLWLPRFAQNSLVKARILA